MRVFKFGGASICNADRIKNLCAVLQKQGVEDLVVVVSAMGKTTNRLEQVLFKYLQQTDYKTTLDDLFDDFLDVAQTLFSDFQTINAQIQNKKIEILDLLEKYNDSPYNFLYDQIISQGELMTSILIAEYLNEQGLSNTLLNAGTILKTDDSYRDASVDWKLTEKNIKHHIGTSGFYITQGFIAQNEQGYITTLGREGSDYTAAILAYCLDASELVVWKDVDGVLNADPRYFEETSLLEHISFHEAIELAYYGASVIHPKTIQPLYSKNIPLRVRSFLNIESKGTVVSEGKALVPDLPCYILKKNQQLLQISSRSFSFIVENDIADIFAILHQQQMKVNLLNNSAISLSLCIDDSLGDIQACINMLQKNYKVVHKKDVTLYTIRNFNDIDFKYRFGNVRPILKQTKDNVMHFVLD